MTVPGGASGISSDDPKPKVTSPACNWPQQLEFDIDTFIGSRNRTADGNHMDSSEGTLAFSGHPIPRSLGDVAFTLLIRWLKIASTAALLLFMVVFVIFGPNAPWVQLTWNILRGGADDASISQCNEIGEWFSLFDQHTDRISSLLNDAGPPADWDTATRAKVAELLPTYMGEWLAAMQQNPPPPAGIKLNALFISFLGNFDSVILAAQQGDLKTQRQLERENSIIAAGMDIEVRHIMNLCI